MHRCSGYPLKSPIMVDDTVTQLQRSSPTKPRHGGYPSRKKMHSEKRAESHREQVGTRIMEENISLKISRRLHPHIGTLDDIREELVKEMLCLERGLV